MKTPLENQELSPRQKQRLCEQFNRTFLDRVVWLTLEEGREVLTRAKFKARVCDGVPCAEFDGFGLQPIGDDSVRTADVDVFSYLNELKAERDSLKRQQKEADADTYEIWVRELIAFMGDSGAAAKEADNKTDALIGTWQKQQERVKALEQQVASLANAHAAQPGAPREDGVWVVRTKSGEYICERKTLEGRTHYTVTSPSMLHVLYDSSIQMHRKHEPLEVPHG